MASGERLAAFALLGEDFLAAANQRVMIDPVEGGKYFRFDPVEKGRQHTHFKGVAPLIEDIAQTFLAPLKDQFFATAVDKTAADQQLVIVMKEVVRRLLRKPVQQGLQRPERAAFTGLVAAEHDVQAGLIGVEFQGPAGEWAEGLQVETLQPHPASP